MDKPLADITIFDGSAADNTGVARFSLAMREKLERKRDEGRGGWNDPQECTIEGLQRMLKEHIKKGDPVDIGNFAMMIWNRQNPRGASHG